MRKATAENFVCQRCGECCRWEGYVRLSEKEIEAAAEHLRLGARAFTKKYTRLTDDRRGLSLVEHEDGACVFFSEKTGKCSINPVKPGQCKKFPILWNFPGWENICRWGKNFASEKIETYDKKGGLI